MKHLLVKGSSGKNHSASVQPRDLRLSAIPLRGLDCSAYVRRTRLDDGCGAQVLAAATGTNYCDTVTAPASRASLREPCTLLTFIPCAIATLVTDAPGTAN